MKGHDTIPTLFFREFEAVGRVDEVWREERRLDPRVKVAWIVHGLG